MNINLSIPVKRLNPTWSGSLYYLFTFLCNGAYAPFIYVYFSELGLSGQQIGFLSILSPVTMLLLSPLISSYVDRKRQRIKTLQVSLIFVAVIFYLIRIPTTFEKIAILMLLMAIFSSPIMSIAEALIARTAQRDHLNYGAMRLWGSFGFAVSALGFGAIWQIWGFKPMFITGALLYIPVIFLSNQLEEIPEVEKAIEHKSPITMLKDKGLVLLLAATLMAAISNSLAMTYNGIYARSLGGGNLLIGMITAFGALAELPIMFYSERIAVRLKTINTILLSYALMAAAFVGYVLTSNADLLLVYTVIRGFGYGLWTTLTIRLVTDRTPAEWASTAQSLLSICFFGLAPLIAGPVGGYLHDVVSPAATFILGIISLAIGAAILWGANISKNLT